MLPEWMENHMMPCIYRKYFGVSCPFCGFQRSLIELFNGDIAQSIRLYPPLLPLFATVVLYISQIVTKKSRLLVWTKWMLITDLVLMIVSCVLKNLGILSE